MLHSVLVGVAFAAAAGGCRVAAEQFVPALLPFIFTVPAVVGATLVAGGLSGALTLLCLQALTADFVLPHWTRDHGGNPAELANLILATVGIALSVWATAAYRTAERSLRKQCHSEVRSLILFAEELDHRTKNNFQIAAALLHSQGLSADSEVKHALELASTRLVAIAGLYGKLSINRSGKDETALLEHVRDLVEVLQASIFDLDVVIRVVGEEIAVSAGVALTVGLVLNEWLTNAAKYAFPQRSGNILVTLRRIEDAVVLEVHDNGVGPSTHAKAGTGSRLISSVAAVHDGVLERLYDEGTLCRLRIPVSH